MAGREYLLLTGALRVFDDFSQVGCSDFAIEHDRTSPGLNTLRDAYSIEKVAGGGDGFSKATNIMRWVHGNVLHNGGTRDVEFVPKDALSILEYAFGKGVEYGVYCRLQAIVFTECCLCIGLPARTIHCLPYSPYDFDSHVVSMVWMDDLKKWVLFDAGNNAYFTDREGMPLSPLEARQWLGLDDCRVGDGLRPTEDAAFADKEAAYIQYMAKNLFYMKFSAINTFGTDLVEGQRTYHLIPVGFDAKAREIAYCEYAIRNCPEPLRGDWEAALDAFRKQTIVAVTQEQFLRVV